MTQSPPSKLACPHCGGAHRQGMRRCPLTNRALGGDARLIGQLIDKRYRVVRLLGDGPFGAVYKAEHVNVGRFVALRILPAALIAQPVVLQRFFHEARLMSSLSHRRLQPMLDAGLSPEGVGYVAYQYVRGRSLAAALALSAPLPLAHACTIVGQVLEGLEAIHESGFVHRALSPDSVLLQATASGHDQALLTNFGASALEEHKDARDRAPAPRVFVPSIYVPPERARGPGASDRREDIFAAGVMLAATLSPAGVARCGGELLAQRVPPTIEAVVARATAVSPGARFPSAAEMRAHLLPFGSLEEDELASATKTHIMDLRVLSRRERALAQLPSRVRLDAPPRVSVAHELAAPILRALRASLPAAAQRELDQRVPALARACALDAPTPLVLMAAALEEADALAGANDRLFCSMVGERAAHDELAGALIARLGRITPEFFFDQVGTEWAKALLGAAPRVTQIGRGYGRLELRDQEEPTLAVCSAFTGVLGETLTVLGGRGVEINKTSCEAVGDPACVFAATWS
ncbi:MAG: protein kinase [Polyangiaceae bacterium]|nr:protein kinase [Polyangiaceae bacterium]